MLKDRPIFIIGVCSMESEEWVLTMFKHIKVLMDKKNLSFIFKASYDKANRTKGESYRGLGKQEGFKVLHEIKSLSNNLLLTDVHTVEEVWIASKYVDILQIPAFLCRQTDLVKAVAKTGKYVNIKKGQFLAPEDIRHIIAKIEMEGNNKILITERGTCFGYSNLINDFNGVLTMLKIGYPVIYDATHSQQGKEKRIDIHKNIIALSRGAIAVGCDGVFIEVHDNPKKALCDGENCLDIKYLNEYIDNVIEIYKTTEVIKNGISDRN